MTGPKPPPEATVATTRDEFGRIDLLTEILGAPRADIVLGIGDDAAVLAASRNPLAASVDVAVEGVHFHRDWLSSRALGRRAFMAATSDLAAMGAKARAALISLVLPGDYHDADLAELARGVRDAADETGCVVIGGNLARGGELSMTTTVLGELSGKPLTRGGCRVADIIWVTGCLGAVGLGLQALLRFGTGAPGDLQGFIERWRSPTARLAEGRALVGLASAAIDISDGLVQDLGHLCRLSAVDALLEAQSLPRAAGYAEAADLLEVDALGTMLHGGEDYELLFTLASGIEPPVPATAIGRIEAMGPGGEPTVRLRESSGVRTIGGGGYRHFGTGAT